MTNSLTSWQTSNDQYLAAALAWLRLRLAHLADPVPDAELQAATARMMEAEATEPPPALLILARQLGMSRFEQHILLLCAALELDTRTAVLCSRAQDDPNRPFSTFALAMALFDDPAWDALSPERPLRYWRLIEINQPGAQPLTASPLRADERIVSYLKGLNYVDDRLTPFLMPFATETAEITPSQAQTAQTILHHLHHTTTIQLTGPDSLSKQLLAQSVAYNLHRYLYRLPVELLPTQPAELETLARLWQRECLLLPLALYLDAQEADHEGSASLTSPLSRFLARCQGIFFLATREARPGMGLVTTAVSVDKPTPAEQHTLWADALAPEQADQTALLAGQFNLNGATIQQIAQQANGNGLWHTCLLHTRPRLDQLAQRLEAKATWDDIVLPEAECHLLGQIASQVHHRSQVYDEWGFRPKMNRGLGINALFAGESGTGKTMAAEVIANELQLDLYRIDLSAVVSKYIGETEKNLRRLFDAAEDGGAILFFDEADALFGKRSEVKDSHDRYANIEINYLLQRMEAYRGLAILATNMKSALDTAFLRRLRFVVNFPFPSVRERQAIWQKAFPPQMPQHNLDFARLARFNLTGGHIHTIAINAAFLAAQHNTPVTMPLLLTAVRTEFRKLERPINEAEFREL